jgi:hypothetical protein
VSLPNPDPITTTGPQNFLLPITDLLDFLPELLSLVKYDEYILFNFFFLGN